MRRIFAVVLAAFLLSLFTPAAASGPGPHSGEFAAWTKMMANGSQIKFYAKYPQPGQKIQFMYQEDSGRYVELDWLRVDHRHLNEDGSYKNLQNGVYFIHTLELKDGKNRVRILVDGKSFIGTKTYSPRPPQPEEDVLPEFSQIESVNLEQCKLYEIRNRFGGGAKGFPHWTYVPVAGTVKISLIPVDFSNAQGDPLLLESFADEPAKISAWSEHFARGKMNYEVQWHGDSWIRAPKEAQWYGMLAEKGGQQLQSRAAALQDLVTTADPIYDFTGVDLIYFIFPLEAERDYGVSMYDQRRQFVSQEGVFTTSVYGEMGGNSNPDAPRSVWDHVVHEILHYQGLVGHGPENGSAGYISTGQWGQAKAIPMWESFLAGWVETDDIVCSPTEILNKTSQVQLNAVDNPAAGPEALMIKLNQEEMIVVEYREQGLYSTWKKGLTAYRLNVNAPHYRCDGCDQLVSEERNWWGYIRQNGSEFITDVTYQGVRIRDAGGGRVIVDFSPASG